MGAGRTGVIQTTYTKGGTKKTSRQNTRRGQRGDEAFTRKYTEVDESDGMVMMMVVVLSGRPTGTCYGVGQRGKREVCAVEGGMLRRLNINRAQDEMQGCGVTKGGGRVGGIIAEECRKNGG